MKKLICICIIMLSFFVGSSVFASNTFYDTRGTKYQGVVERMAKLEIINGMNETTFAPNKNVTRAELAKIIVKMKGIENFANDIEYKKAFSDVKKDDWFYPYVLIAADLELVNGYQDGTFRPNQPVTYAELATIFLRYLGYTNITQDSPNGWYWNYIVRMRQIELNDNVGEFDYTTPAKRGDVAMFAWNALITDRWAISFENEKEGLTYTYSQKSPLEMYFEDYRFIDNQIVRNVIGYDGKPGVIVGEKIFYTEEKVPLYVLGGRVTGLYEKNSDELIGVTFDEDNVEADIISGPIFYLEEEGYRLQKAKNVAYYGSKNKATYAYVIEGEEKTIPERVVYVDGTNTIWIEKLAVKTGSGENDDELIEEIELNEEKFTSMNSALVESGFGYSFSTLSTGDFITNLGNGLYVKNTKKIEDIISDLKREDGEIEIWLDEDKYIVLEECLCYEYGEKDPVTIDSIDLEDYIKTSAVAYLNVAEEVYKIEFGKTDKENERYIFGYITEVINYQDTTKQTIEVNVTDTKKERYKFDSDGKTFFVEGDFVAVGKEKKEDSVLKCTLLEKDTAFDNDISVKYDYDAKAIKAPMIGEYMVTKDTEYYKVNLKYEKNSITRIESCKIEDLKLDDLEDLMAYKLHLIYDENMEILKVYAVNEVNKFENQVALVRDKKRVRTGSEAYTYNVSLSITEDIVTAFEVEETEFAKYNIGNIVTFRADEEDEENIEYVEEFRREFIGYKRDLVVEEFETKTNSIVFNDGTKMNLDEDIYTWNNKKINLNNYRFIIAKVYKDGDTWNFASLKMQEKEDLKVEKNDRFALGEINGVIVIYRGYVE